MEGGLGDYGRGWLGGMVTEGGGGGWEGVATNLSQIPLPISLGLSNLVKNSDYRFRVWNNFTY